ncbi:MAG TPA: LysE family translocator [Blastocatellia bacterium]|nr:LysE family translocator [Blastocatellia bacterium]
MNQPDVEAPMSFRLWLVFAITEFLLSMTPGPAVLLVISQGMKFGARPGVRGALGILTGNALYFALSAMGLGTLLVASATLFQIIKWAGAGYLIFIGVRMLLVKGELAGVNHQSAVMPRAGRLFSQGLITQLSNPKAIIFFTALLPQFITPGSNVVWQFTLLGVTSILVEFPVLVAYGWMAERGGKLIPEGRLSALPDRLAGTFLIGTGISLATVRKP